MAADGGGGSDEHWDRVPVLYWHHGGRAKTMNSMVVPSGPRGTFSKNSFILALKLFSPDLASKLKNSFTSGV